MHSNLSLMLGIFVCISYCSHGVSAEATDIYKWRGPDGVVHYSETPPEAALASVELISLEAAPQAAQATARDYRELLEVANAIETGRLERERLRFEKRQLQSQRRAQARPPADRYSVPPARIYYPPYYRYPPAAGYGYRYGTPYLERQPVPRDGPGHRPPSRNRPNSLAHIKP